MDLTQVQILGHGEVSAGCCSNRMRSPDTWINTSHGEHTLDPPSQSPGCDTPVWLGVGHKEQFGVTMDIGHLQGNK